MGFGKLAFSVIMIVILGFVLVSAFSSAVAKQPTDAFYNDNTTQINKTTAVATTVVGASTTLFVPIIAISGILLLASAFYLFRRHPTI